VAHSASWGYTRAARRFVVLILVILLITGALSRRGEHRGEGDDAGAADTAPASLGKGASDHDYCFGRHEDGDDEQEFEQGDRESGDGVCTSWSLTRRRNTTVYVRKAGHRRAL